MDNVEIEKLIQERDEARIAAKLAWMKWMDADVAKKQAEIEMEAAETKATYLSTCVKRARREAKEQP